MINKHMNIFATRSLRVIVLVSITVVLGVLDLALTIHYMGTIGLPEANPLARLLAEISPGLLVAGKLALVAINAGLLLALVKQRSAEIGAWVSCIVLVALTIHWTNYIAADLNGAFSDIPAGKCLDGWTCF